LVRNSYRSGQTPVYDPKPAYFAAKTLANLIGDYRFEARLNIGSADDYVLVFAKDSERRFVAWTISPSARRVILTNIAGSYSVVSATGQSLDSITATSGALTLDLTSTPKYLTPLH